MVDLRSEQWKEETGGRGGAGGLRCPAGALGKLATVLAEWKLTDVQSDGAERDASRREGRHLQ